MFESNKYKLVEYTIDKPLKEMKVGLNYKVGNLLVAAADGWVDTIIHQANCFNTMKSGFAKQLVEYIQEAEAVDNLTIAGDKYKLGSYSKVHGWYGIGDVNVINMYSQYHYGADKQQTDYEAMRSALRLMVVNGEIDEYCHIGMPKVGAGLGGGDWEKISEIIAEELDGFKVTVYVLDEKEIPNE